MGGVIASTPEVVVSSPIYPKKLDEFGVGTDNKIFCHAGWNSVQWMSVETVWDGDGDAWRDVHKLVVIDVLWFVSRNWILSSPTFQAWSQKIAERVLVFSCDRARFCSPFSACKVFAQREAARIIQ
jgi:hypothetical protein